MPQATGANAQMIYQAEAAYGVTNPSPDAIMLPILSESLSQKRSLVKTNIIRQSRQPVKPGFGKKDVGGSIPTELNPFMGVLLKHLFGSVVTTGAGANKVHTGKIAALPVGLSFEKGFTDLGKYFLYNGCRINKANFEFGPEGKVPASFDFLGKKRTKSGASFDSTPINYGHVAWDMFEASILEGGIAIATVINVKLDIENELDGEIYCIGGGGERRAIPEGATLVSGSLTALFEDDTLLDKAIAGTETSIKIILQRGSGDGTAGNEYLEFLYPEMMYEERDPLITGPKGILIELPFAAYYDNSAEQSAAQFVLKNTQAAL